MRKHNILLLGLSLALVASLPADALQRHGGGQRSGTATTGQRGTMMQDRDTMRDRSMSQDRDMMQDRNMMQDGSVYGWQLMSPAERDAYRSHMRSLRTEREREAFRMQHHEEMQQRAARQGVTLPDVPRQSQGGQQNGGGQR